MGWKTLSTEKDVDWTLCLSVLHETEKNGKKDLTNYKESAKIVKLSRDGDPSRILKKTFLKKSQKNFKKGIDKGKMMWYNSQAVRKSGKRTVIENWTTREKYKA